MPAIRWIVLLLVVILGWAAFTGRLPGFSAPAKTPAPLATPAVARSLPPAAPTLSAAFDARVAAFTRALQNGQPASLAITEREATDAARAALAQQDDDRLRHLTVRFADGRIEAGATVSLQALEVPVVAVLRPVVNADGTVDVQVDQVRVAGTAPPLVEGLARSLVEEQIARRADQPDWLAVRQLQISNGQLRVDAAPR